MGIAMGGFNLKYPFTNFKDGNINNPVTLNSGSGSVFNVTLEIKARVPSAPISK
jgi:hypothetical protein